MAPDRPTVVLVEDDEGLRCALVDLLVTSGFDVLSYASAEAAISEAPLHVSHCMILDIGLPGMSGLDLLRRLHGGAAVPPSIVITADDRPATRAAALRLGVSTYLEMPVLGRELVIAVRAATAR